MEITKALGKLGSARQSERGFTRASNDVARRAGGRGDGPEAFFATGTPWVNTLVECPETTVVGQCLTAGMIEECFA